MKISFALLVAVTASLHVAAANAYVTRNNGINWDKNGMPVCSYGAIKSCQTAAAYGDRNAQAYVDQRLPSKTPVKASPVICNAWSCKPASIPTCRQAFPNESGYWGQYKAFGRCA